MADVASEILAATSGRTLDDYLADSALRAVVERKFIILGEALSQLATRNPEVAFQIPDYRVIINFRHVLVHGYHQVRHAAVWGIVDTHLPSLYATVLRLLEDIDE